MNKNGEDKWSHKNARKSYWAMLGGWKGLKHLGYVMVIILTLGFARTAEPCQEQTRSGDGFVIFSVCVWGGGGSSGSGRGGGNGLNSFDNYLLERMLGNQSEKPGHPGGGGGGGISDFKKIEEGDKAVDSAQKWLNDHKNCNDFIAASRRSTSIVDPKSVIATLDNIKFAGKFFPLGGGQGTCGRAIAYACPAEDGRTCNGGTPANSITLCDPFFQQNDTMQVLVILHEVWNLYGESHSGSWGDIIPYLDAVPYSVDLAYACDLPCPDGYSCTPGVVP